MSLNNNQDFQTIIPENNWDPAFFKNISPEMSRWLQTIFHTSGGTFYIYDVAMQHFIQLFNLPWFILEQHGSDDIKLLNWEDWMHPDDTQNFRLEIQRIIKENQKIFSIEIRLGTNKTGWNWYLNHGELIALPEGTTLLTGMFSDISKQKELQQQLLQTLAETTRLEQMKAQFLANMSHELRTPLNGILGCVKLLEMSSLDIEQKELAEGIDQSVHRMMKLVQNVLLLTEIESGSLRSITESFHPGKLLEGIIQDHQRLYTYANVDVNIELEENIPERLIADKENISRILNQLVDNAFKHTTNGQVALKARMLETDYTDKADSNDTIQSQLPKVKLTHNDQPSKKQSSDTTVQWLEIEVHDTGIGIEPGFISVISESFSLSDASYTRQYQGAGLGLSICKKCAEMIHANIWVDSQLNKGSRFYVHIPVRRVIIDNTNTRKRTALVVDDDETSRILMGMFCEHTGLQPTLVSSAVEALQYIDKTFFDMILLDIQMPFMNGLDAATIIREKQKQPGVKSLVIAVTAYMTPEDTENYLAHGFDDYLQKPINLKYFESKLQKWEMVPYKQED